MYTPHKYCRACGYGTPGASGIKSGPSPQLVEAFDLGIQPLANDFASPNEEHAGYAPLKVMFCPACSLAQLSVTVRPEILYRNYSYVTSPSAMMHAHFEQLIKDIGSENTGTSVLEIGSNDGKLLLQMKDSGYSVLGVDPAENLAEIARKSGVPTQTGFFDDDLARVLPQSDIVIARHVFCHVDIWQDFIKGLEAVMSPDSIACLEVPYAGDLLKKCEFDTIYHEHLSYLTIRAVQALLDQSGLHLHRIIRYPIHGGALLLILRKNECPLALHESVCDFKEDITISDWKAFAVEAKEQIGRLRATVDSLLAQGKRVAGLGASAKSTVWINACGFNRKHIGFISDTTLQKQWRMSPGTDIPITDEGAILRELPDYVVMWAWNYREEVLQRFSLARSKGVKFIVPVPRVEIV